MSTSPEPAHGCTVTGLSRLYGFGGAAVRKARSFVSLASLRGPLSPRRRSPDFSSREQLPSLRVCQPAGMGKPLETVRFPALHTSKPPNNQTSGKPKFLIEPFFKLYHPQCTRLLISLSFSFSLQLESLPLQLAATREKLRTLHLSISQAQGAAQRIALLPWARRARPVAHRDARPAKHAAPGCQLRPPVCVVLRCRHTLSLLSRARFGGLEAYK